ELHCTYDPNSRGGWTEDGRKVKGTLHWVSAQHAVPVEIRLYEHLFSKEDPEEVEEGQDFTANINPNSLRVLSNALAEPDLKNAKPGDRFQFLRQGYFTADLKDHSAEHPVFNRTVTLRDSWAKIEKKLKS
ncbi:glutamine--tRNA ligase, partial [candidate division KSB1 bacterium]